MEILVANELEKGDRFSYHVNGPVHTHLGLCDNGIRVRERDQNGNISTIPWDTRIIQVFSLDKSGQFNGG